MIGISATTFSDLLHGRRALSFDIARSLHKVLGVPLLILLMNLRDLSSVSSRKHQYSSGRFQYILDSNITAVYLLQLFLCQLLSLLAVHFILLHNRINFMLNLLVQRYDKFL